VLHGRPSMMLGAGQAWLRFWLHHSEGRPPPQPRSVAGPWPHLFCVDTARSRAKPRPTKSWLARPPP